MMNRCLIFGGLLFAAAGMAQEGQDKNAASQVEQVERVKKALADVGIATPAGAPHFDRTEHFSQWGGFRRIELCPLVRKDGQEPQEFTEWSLHVGVIPRVDEPAWKEHADELCSEAFDTEEKRREFQAKTYLGRWVRPFGVEPVAYLADPSSEEARQWREKVGLEVFDLDGGARVAVIRSAILAPNSIGGYFASARFQCGGVEACIGWKHRMAANSAPPQNIEEFKKARAAAGSAALKDFAGKLHDALKRHAACECGSGAVADGATRIELLDANPLFNDGWEFTLDANRDVYTERTISASVQRNGTTADGVSLLLIRAKLDGPGTAVFGVESGYLHQVAAPIDRKKAGETTLKVSSAEWKDGDKKGHWAFALYRPPESCGEGRGVKQITLTLEAQPSSGGASSKWERKVGLARVPVVLVHGTFDNPSECWALKSEHSPMTMKERLAGEGIPVFMVDWVETNGHKDPSDFSTNRHTVWKNPGGIHDALETIRKDGIAATQADVVGHSQGGVIARVYAVGSMAPRSADEDHFTDPEACARGVCWYHRKDNWGRGDIHRLITISATHKGSDCSRVLDAFVQLRSEGTETSSWDDLCASMALLGAGYQGNDTSGFLKEFVRRMGQGPLTGGYKDQIPQSAAYAAIGRTPIPAHAIACTCEDEDMMQEGEEYQNRWEKIWTVSSQALLVAAFRKLGQPEDAEELARLKDEQEAAVGAANAAGQDLPPVIAEKRRANARRLRAATFGNCPNDSTVRQESSLGGLAEKYTTVLPRVLHGYAPRYTSVQEMVVRLLKNDGGLFCAEGFPEAGGAMENRQYKPDGGAARKVEPDAPRGETAERVMRAMEATNELVKAKRYEDAEKMLRGELADLPVEADLWSTLANMCAFQEHWADAVAAARKVIDLRPDDGDSHAELAGFLYQDGKRDEALKEAKEAKRLGVEGHPVFKDLGLE